MTDHAHETYEFNDSTDVSTFIREELERDTRTETKGPNEVRVGFEARGFHNHRYSLWVPIDGDGHSVFKCDETDETLFESEKRRY